MRMKALVVVGVVCAVAGSWHPARACIEFGSVRQIDIRPVVKPKPVSAVDLLAAADQRLEEERLGEAMALVKQAFPHLESDHVDASPLETHAKRIFALATVRKIPPIMALATERGAAPASRPPEKLQWAVATLRVLHDQRGDDPRSLADLGEALAADPSTESEGAAVLDDLAARDLLGSAHGFAALARIHARSGDSRRSAVFLQRCQAMTRSPEAVCKVPEPQLAIR
jgi:hypothetical protein